MITDYDKTVLGALPLPLDFLLREDNTSDKDAQQTHKTILHLFRMFKLQ